ncbi:MAG: GNAT family N-acetyltransferase [Gammaproteobacteria bacterium]
MLINEFDQPVGLPCKGWTAREMPKNEVLRGKYCVLEPLNIQLYGLKLFEALQFNNRGETWTYLPYGPFANGEEFCLWLEKTNSEFNTQLYCILDNHNNSLGIAGYLRINPEHGVIEVGHLHYSKQLQRTRITTEAMYLMMRHAFDDLGYRRYEWKCNSLNEPSKTAALRLGFKFEGIFRQSNVFKNLNRDTAWFSIIDNEWPMLKIKFEKWLEESNFDPNGKQIIKLSEI